MDNYKIYRCGGVVIEYNNKRFLFDPWGKCDKKFDAIFISHAHSDHFSGIKFYLKSCNCPIFLSRETFRILLDIYQIPLTGQKVVLVSRGDVVEIDGIDISFHNSGHVIGGLMFRLDLPHVSIGYTGDFNYEDTAVLDKADVLGTDVLIMDTTYGVPTYSFPSRKMLYNQIKELLMDIVDNGKIPILHGYALGKGQELTRVAYEALKRDIGVDKRVGFFNRLYERSLGKPLGEYGIGEIGSAIIRGISGRKYRSNQHVHIFFTGWAMIRNFNAGISFPLSSHNSFIKLLEYVIESTPSKIHTLFGFEKQFAKFVKKDLGIDAEPIPTYPNMGKKSNKEKNYGLDTYINEPDF
ncbi:MAG: MBL fold metallo-hydrolase [Candidatus Njordarchaeia archaeon]